MKITKSGYYWVDINFEKVKDIDSDLREFLVKDHYVGVAFVRLEPFRLIIWNSGEYITKKNKLKINRVEPLTIPEWIHF